MGTAIKLNTVDNDTTMTMDPLNSNPNIVSPLTSDEVTLLSGIFGNIIGTNSILSLVEKQTKMIESQNAIIDEAFNTINDQRKICESLKQELETQRDNYSALYLKYQSTFDQTASNIKALVSQINTSVISAKKNDSDEVNEKTKDIINPNNSVDKSSSVDINKWTDDAWRILNMVAPKFGIDGKTVCGHVYARMKKKYDVNVHQLYQTWNKHNTGSMMKMCINNDTLRNMFEVSLVEIYNEMNGRQDIGYGNKFPKSIQAQRIPDSIRRDCRRLFPTIPDNVAWNRIYDRIRDIKPDIDEYIQHNNCTIPYKAFSKAYFIANNAYAKGIYREAISQLSKEA